MKGTSIDAIMLTVVRVVTMLLGLVCVKIVSVYFSLDQFGLYSQAMLIVSTVASIIILGLTDSVNYFYNSESSRTINNSRAEYLSTIFLLETIIGVVAGVTILLFSPLLTSYFKSPGMSATYIWIAFQPLLQSYMAMFGVLYISIGKTKLIVLFNLFFSLFRCCIFLISALYTKSILTLIQLTLVLDVLQVIAFVVLLRGNGVGLNLTKSVARLICPILKYSVPVAMFVLINSLLRDCDKWIIGRLGNADELALYTNASRVLPFDMMMAAFTTVLVPIITRHASTDKRRAANVLGHYLNLGLVTTTILVGSAIWLSRDLMLTLYDAKYLPGLGVFIIFLFVDFVRFANVSLIFNATGRTRILLIVITSTFVFNLITAVGLYEIFGILGPAIATLGSMLLCNTMFLYLGRRILDTSLFRLLEWKKFALIVAEIVLIGGSIMWLGGYIMDGTNCVVRFLVLYTLISFSVGVLNRHSIVKLLRYINKEK